MCFFVLYVIGHICTVSLLSRGCQLRTCGRCERMSGVAEKCVSGNAGRVRGQRDSGEVCGRSYRLVNGGSGITSALSSMLFAMKMTKRPAGVPVMFADYTVV